MYSTRRVRELIYLRNSIYYGKGYWSKSRKCRCLAPNCFCRGEFTSMNAWIETGICVLPIESSIDRYLNIIEYKCSELTPAPTSWAAPGKEPEDLQPRILRFIFCGDVPCPRPWYILAILLKSRGYEYLRCVNLSTGLLLPLNICFRHPSGHSVLSIYIHETRP